MFELVTRFNDKNDPTRFCCSSQCWWLCSVNYMGCLWHQVMVHCIHGM